MKKALRAMKMMMKTKKESDTTTRMKKWKVQRGFKSAIEDDDIDKYINVHSSSHGMDSEDFWRAGF